MSDHGDGPGEAHGHADDIHGPVDEALGPVDAAAWGAGIAGIAIAIVMAACFALATSGLG